MAVRIGVGQGRRLPSLHAIVRAVMKEKQSPRIIHISWGRMEVEGLGLGKDFKLYPGGGREWDWKETNTEHIPGIQPADVQELLEKGSKVVVLAAGCY